MEKRVYDRRYRNPFMHSIRDPWPFCKLIMNSSRRQQHICEMPVKSDRKMMETTCFTSMLHCEHNICCTICADAAIATAPKENGNNFSIEWHLKMWVYEPRRHLEYSTRAQTFIFRSKDFIAAEHKLHTDEVFRTRHAHYIFLIKKRKKNAKILQFPWLVRALGHLRWRVCASHTEFIAVSHSICIDPPNENDVFASRMQDRISAVQWKFVIVLVDQLANIASVECDSYPKSHDHVATTELNRWYNPFLQYLYSDYCRMNANIETRNIHRYCRCHSHSLLREI